MASVSPATRYRPITSDALDRRALVNRLNLTTPLGHLIARLGRASIKPGPHHLTLAEGYRLKFPIAGAFTVGNVIISAHRFDDLEANHPGVLGHEDRHAWQYFYLGLLFLPTYALASIYSWLRYRDLAVGNIFERKAGLISGRYVAPGYLRGRRPNRTS